LSPLLASGIDAAKAKELKEQICKEHGISERTVRRYLSMYSLNGFFGLKPKSKGRPPSEAISPEIVDQAILLRREVPSRSVAQIIQILEWEGKIAPGEIKRSTLQEKLANHGYSTRHMRMYSDSGVAARRFQHRRRNSLWHSDIKYVAPVKGIWEICIQQYSGQMLQSPLSIGLLCRETAQGNKACR
jgi:hypothetical protein